MDRKVSADFSVFFVSIFPLLGKFSPRKRTKRELDPIQDKHKRIKSFRPVTKDKGTTV